MEDFPFGETRSRRIVEQIFLVTGAGSGIGHSIATMALNNNHKVILVMKSEKNIEKIQNEFLLHHLNYQIIVKDLMQNGGIDELFKELRWEPNIVVNNLGGSFRQDTWSDEKLWNDVLKLNLIIPHLINMKVLERLKSQDWGRLIHISSMAAIKLDGYGPYAVAKSALETYVRRIGIELSGTGVVATCISPGPVAVEGRFLTNLFLNETSNWLKWCEDNFLRSKTLIDPNEISSLVKYLTTPEAKNFNGSIIPIHGGNY